jgi:osmotically-inducible protein OsmY
MLLLVMMIFISSVSTFLVADFGTVFDNQTEILSDTDQSIQQQVRLALQKNSSLNSNNIQFTVENGKVTLTGTVKSDSEKSIAATTVTNVPGVTWVQNDLVINNQ